MRYIFDDPEFAELKEVESILDALFQFLMLECPMMFIFYHELAHQHHFKNDFELSDYIKGSF